MSHLGAGDDHEVVGLHLDSLTATAHIIHDNHGFLQEHIQTAVSQTEPSWIAETDAESSGCVHAERIQEPIVNFR